MNSKQQQEFLASVLKKREEIYGMSETAVDIRYIYGYLDGIQFAINQFVDINLNVKLWMTALLI